MTITELTERVEVHPRSTPLTMIVPNRVHTTLNVPHEFPVIYDPHTWLANLRDHVRMLSGELKLPHEIKFSGNARQRKKARRAEERGEATLISSSATGHRHYNSRCQVCLKAAKQRRAYQRQILSEE